MPKRLIKESILVVRDGKRIKPEIGKSFDLTKAEIDELTTVRPQAIGQVNGVEEDPRSTPTAGSSDSDSQGGAIDLASIDLDAQDRATLLDIAKALEIQHPKNVSEDKLRELIREKNASDEKL